MRFDPTPQLFNGVNIFSGSLAVLKDQNSGLIFFWGGEKNQCRLRRPENAFELVDPAGLEPAISSLQMRRSTTELRALKIVSFNFKFLSF